MTEVSSELPQRVAVVGAGLVGRAWAIVFARAGLEVRVFDGDPGIRAEVARRIGESLADLKDFGLVEDPAAIAGRIAVSDSLAATLEGAGYVQESVFELSEVKRRVYRELDPLLGSETLVGSSSSGIPASDFTEGLANRTRMLVAHPVNPPYLVPIVELVPAPWTAPAALERTHALMTAVGQVPIRVRREVEGFVLNRLQGALLREAWALYEEGYCSLADLDKTVAHGLGLRWSFMGPFETIDLNAPGGIADYAERLGPLYLEIARSRGRPEPWSPELISRVEAERREDLPPEELGARSRWRDQRLMALAAHKAATARKLGT